MSQGINMLFIEHHLIEYSASIIIPLLAGGTLYLVLLFKNIISKEPKGEFGLYSVILGNFMPLLFSNLIREYAFYLGILLGVTGSLCFIFSQAAPWRKVSIIIAGLLPLFAFVLLIHDLETWFMLDKITKQSIDPISYKIP